MLSKTARRMNRRYVRDATPPWIIVQHAEQAGKGSRAEQIEQAPGPATGRYTFGSCDMVLHTLTWVEPPRRLHIAEMWWWRTYCRMGDGLHV